MNKSYNRERLVLAFLTMIFASQAFAQNSQKPHFTFVNVADSTQGLSGFSQFPAINHQGAVAFVARSSDGNQNVFKWHEGAIQTIASEADGLVKSFGDDVAINREGVVAYDGSPTSTANDRAIFTSNGIWTKTIVDANQQGLIARFFGAPSINASGTVAFFAERRDTSRAVFTGSGESLTAIADTKNSSFAGFGDAAINNSEQVAFLGFLKDFSPGVFVATPNKERRYHGDPEASAFTITAVADPTSTLFSDPGVSFEDPAINADGTIADVAFLSNQNLVVFTGNHRSLTARTDPNSSFFLGSEHPSINNHGAVAFSVDESSGGKGIFVEVSGGANPVAVLQSGDPLFGSTVNRLTVGRFAFNNHFRLVFGYTLQDGRSGIAIAALHRNREIEKSDEEDDDEQ